MGSSITIGLGFEPKRSKSPTMVAILVSMYRIGLIDRPAAKDFVKRWHAKYPDEFYINDMGENEYSAVFMYKKLVEMGGSTDIAKIREQIATGKACIDAPEGQICIDPKSQHASHQMTQLSVAADHSVKVERTWDRVDPYWLGQIGCDLTKDDPKDQYTPSNLPSK